MRLPGSVCTAPQDHEVENSVVWAWDYYRPDCASRWASRITVNLRPDGSCLVATFYHDVDGNQRMAVWKALSPGDGLDVALGLAASGIEGLREVAPLPWEYSPGRAALFDAGFHSEETEGADQGTLMSRTREDGLLEQVDGLLEYGVMKNESFVVRRRDVVDHETDPVAVSLYDSVTGGKAVTRCDGVADALEVLDGWLLPVPEAEGTVHLDRDELSATSPRPR